MQSRLAGLHGTDRALPDGAIFCGFVAFFINYVTYKGMGIPVAELIVFAFVFYAFLQQKNFTAFFSAKGFLLFFGLLVWITLADAVNAVELSAWVREIIRNVVLLFPVLCFSVAPNRSHIPAFAVGLIIGFAFLFAGNVLWALATVHSIPLELKWMLPTPSVFLVTSLFLRKHVSSVVQWSLIFGFIVSLVGGMSVEGRGAVISLALAGGFAAVARFFAFPARTIPVLTVFLLTLHFTAALVYDSVFGLAMNYAPTWSNLERAALIDFSMEKIEDSPFVGMGQRQFTDAFKWNFETLIHFAADSERRTSESAGFFRDREDAGTIVETPHNEFLEFSVFYGLPGGLLWLGFFGCFARYAMLDTPHPVLTAAALSMVVRHGALYGLTNLYRLEWFATAFVIIWVMRTERWRQPCRSLIREIPILWNERGH